MRWDDACGGAEPSLEAGQRRKALLVVGTTTNDHGRSEDEGCGEHGSGILLYLRQGAEPLPSKAEGPGGKDARREER